jgi:hypothetical protein
MKGMSMTALLMVTQEARRGYVNVIVAGKQPDAAMD